LCRYNFCFRHKFIEAVCCCIFAYRLQKILALPAYSSAYRYNVGLQYILYAHNSIRNILSILLYNSLRSFVTLLCRIKRRSARNFAFCLGDFMHKAFRIFLHCYFSLTYKRRYRSIRLPATTFSTSTRFSARNKSNMPCFARSSVKTAKHLPIQNQSAANTCSERYKHKYRNIVTTHNILSHSGTVCIIINLDRQIKIFLKLLRKHIMLHFYVI